MVDTLGFGASEQRGPEDSKSHFGKRALGPFLSLTAQGFLPTFLSQRPEPHNWESGADHKRTWFSPPHLSALCTPHEAGEWLSLVPPGARMYHIHNMDVVLEEDVALGVSDDKEIASAEGGT